MGNKQKLIYLGSVYDSWFLHRKKLNLSDEKFAELLLRTWLEFQSFQKVSSSNETISKNPNSEECLIGSELTKESSIIEPRSNPHCLGFAEKFLEIQLQEGLDRNDTCTAGSEVNNENFDSSVHMITNIEKQSNYQCPNSLEELSTTEMHSIPESVQLPSEQFIIPDPINNILVTTQLKEEVACIFEASCKSIVDPNYLNEMPAIVPTVNTGSTLMFKVLKTEPEDCSINSSQHSTESFSASGSINPQEESYSSNDSSTSIQEKNKSKNIEAEEPVTSETNIVHNNKKQRMLSGDIYQEQNHLNTHSKENTSTFKCIYCGKAFMMESCLTNHLKTHTEKSFSCKICHKVFHVKALLRVHLKTHAGVKSFSCDRCDKSFVTYNTLYCHQRTHTDEKPYKCDHCKLAFKKKSNLSQHATIHTGVRPYKCHICGNEYRQKACLVTHLRYHTQEKPYACYKCDQSFATQYQLSGHMYIHSENKSLKCEFCSKAFKSNDSLFHHLKTHSSLKPYKCEYCGKAFNFLGELTSHMRVHTVEKPYSCGSCDKKFVEKTCLNNHMKIHTVIDQNNTTEIHVATILD